MHENFVPRKSQHSDQRIRQTESSKYATKRTWYSRELDRVVNRVLRCVNHDEVLFCGQHCGSDCSYYQLTVDTVLMLRFFETNSIYHCNLLNSKNWSGNTDNCNQCKQSSNRVDQTFDYTFPYVLLSQIHKVFKNIVGFRKHKTSESSNKGNFLAVCVE